MVFFAIKLGSSLAASDSGCIWTYVTGSMYILIHFYCLAVEAGFYSDMVKCLPVDPATWVRFQAGTG